SPRASEVSVLVFCAAVFCMLFFGVRLLGSDWRPVSVGVYVTRWSEEVYSRFRGLGANLREFVREARDLIHTAYQAHETMLGLEARVNRGAEAARSVSRAAREARAALQALHTELEALRGEAGKYGVRPLERRA